MQAVALFLSSPSPGRVYQFLLRRATTSAERQQLATFDLHLSDAVGNHNLRALVPFANRDTAADFLREFAEPLAQAFPDTAVTLLVINDTGFVWQMWKVDGSYESGETIVTSNTESKSRRLPLQRWLLRAKTSDQKITDAVRQWAKPHGLPLNRLPTFAAKNLPIVTYQTVATLDRRSLLVETSPRLYAFLWN